MFEQIIGNDKVKQSLTKAVKTNAILHSYLFLGEEGIGKSLFAKEFAKAILCENSLEGSYCKQCKSCKEIDENNHPDFMKITPEGNTIKVEQIRKMQQKIAEKPIISLKKVYIIEESNTMTKEAQNCLLKTLEEPPAYAVIILIAANENALLNTIISRCIKVTFQRIEDSQIEQYIKENITDEISENMIQMCEGSIGKAQKLKDNYDAYQQVETMLDKIKQVTLIEVLELGEVLYKAEDKIEDILNYMNIVCYHKKKMPYLNSIAYIEEVKKRLKANANTTMTVDYLLIKMWEEIN